MNFKEKWSIDKYEMGFSKVFCVHGVSISRAISLALQYKNDIINITFIPYEEFITNYDTTKFVNLEDLTECDLIAVIGMCNNNTLEIQLLKISITILYFAERFKQSSKRIKNFHKLFSPIEDYHDYFANYTLFDGYYTKDSIYMTSWYIGIGKQALHEDNFERWTTRIYGEALADSYDRRAGIPRLGIPCIDVDNILIDFVENILQKVNSDCEYGKKLKSALRLYYEVLCDFKNPDYTVITYCTIFETLLLKHDEDSQRKKVAARAACITCDNLDFKYKRFVADQVYHFYKYRNAIIHDGEGLLDFDNEMLFNRTLYGIKNIVFCIIKYIVMNKINTHSNLMDIVEKNVHDDGLERGFDYINLAKFGNPNYTMNLYIE